MNVSASEATQAHAMPPIDESWEHPRVRTRLVVGCAGARGHACIDHG